MDKRVLRERMRRKKRQMMIRHYTKIGLCVIGMILAVVFVVRGIIIPIAHHVAGGGSSDQTVQAQADTEEVQANSDAAVRQPLKGKSDTDKVAAMTAGWHEDANGKWYQNTDGTYFSNGFQDIDGVTYSFDENGYIQTGWVEKGVKDYYFNEDGSYDPSKVRPMLALTFDDGPNKENTTKILKILKDEQIHATFFLTGNNVERYPDVVKAIYESGNAIGIHSYSHDYKKIYASPQAYMDEVDKTAGLIYDVIHVRPVISRAPGGTAGHFTKAFWQALNQEGYIEVGWNSLTGDADGTGKTAGKEVENIKKQLALRPYLHSHLVILMHDASGHQATVEALPELIKLLKSQGYTFRVVTTAIPPSW